MPTKIDAIEALFRALLASWVRATGEWGEAKERGVGGVKGDRVKGEWVRAEWMRMWCVRSPWH